MGYLENILGQSEKIVFSTRQHWLVIWRPIVVSVILAALIVAAVIGLLTPTIGLSLLGLVLLVLPLGKMIMVVLDWLNETYIVTNRRIIQTEGVFNKHIADSSLEKVNDVVMDQSFWGRLWGYGDIQIMTASEIGVNKLHMLANPVRFKTTMLDQKEGLSDPDVMRRVNHSDHADHGDPNLPPNREEIPDLIAELAGLRDRGILTAEEFEKKKAELMGRM
jgi:uncharacterized membrane protein YdbT with pleckstrin-like domain